MLPGLARPPRTGTVLSAVSDEPGSVPTAGIVPLLGRALGPVCAD